MNPPEKKTLFLIDGTAYIHRAFHAIRNLRNSQGLPTNAVFGFTRMLIKLIEDRHPEYAVICFDARGPTFRHKIYADYKANRPPMPEDMAVQIPYIKQVVQGFRLPVMEMTGYEADDLIGTLARQAQARDFSVVMVTGDKDFMQLVTDTVTIWDPMKDKVIDVSAVREIAGVSPEQIVDVMGLSGDTADNVPGVPGIGPKTASSLIQSFGSIDNLYEAVETISQKKQKENLIRFKDQALLSRQLVTIDTDCPVAFSPECFKRQEPDSNVLAGLFKTLEFRALQQAFPATADRRAKTYRGIRDKEALDELAAQLSAADIFAIDTETTSPDPMKASLVGLSFAVTPDAAVYIPCGHHDVEDFGQLPIDMVLDALRPVLQDPKKAKVGQNIKYDWIVLERHGVSLSGVAFDTMVASYLLNPSKRAHNLDQIALDFLDYQKISFQEVAGKGKVLDGFAGVPIEKGIDYACEDADITLLSYRVLSEKLDALGLTALMQTVEMPLVPVLKAMEMTGVCVNRNHLAKLSKSFAQQIETIEDDIHRMAGETFNINSPQQLGAILFEKLKLPVQKRTKKKTGYSTDVDVLTTLAVHHELPALVLRHRSLVKLKSTYTDALQELIHPDTGRIHTSYNQTVTATGRLSSSEPNLQNIPVRTEEGRQIRAAFVPRPGWTMVSADYSQIELRILAHCSQDPILIQAFVEDQDIHTRTASEVFEVFPQMITDELRRQAKAINFGIIYGMSPFGLSRQLGISQKMAKTYIHNYFSRYKGVKRFMDETIAAAEKTGQTATLLERIRLLPDIHSKNRTVKQFAERMAINTPIQGSAADLIKLAMIRVHEALAAGKWRASMLLTVHDELVFEVPPEELEALSAMVTEIMEGVWDLRVPLKVNLASGKNWAQAL
jgi:DNA polymerase-1